MKHTTKVWLIVAGALVLLGLALLIGAMALNHWDLSGGKSAEYETRTVEIQEDFQNISIRSDTEDIDFAVSDDGGCRVVFTERKDAPHTAAVTGGTLRIEREKTENRLSFFSLFSFGSPKITVLLPQRDYASLLIEESTGNVVIPKDFTFERVSVTVSTGQVSCDASAAGPIQITTSTGRIRIADISAGELALSVTTGGVELRSVECAGALRVSVSTGKAQLTDVSCQSLQSTGSTGALTLERVLVAGKLTVERSTGDVRLTQCDAGELEIRTNTGDVTGSLCSEKVFIAKSDTGRVEVPETISGGKCKITTDTGDIRITINNGN